MRSKWFFSLLLVFVFALASSVNVPAVNAGKSAAGAAYAATSPEEEVHVHLRMLADTKAVQAGKPFKVGVELTMDPGWHTYYKECGDAGMPTTIKWELPPGFKAGDLLWNKPNKFNDGGIVTYGYAGKTVIAAVITPPASLDGVKPLTFKADVKWLSCKEICLPGKGSSSIDLPVAKSDAAPQPDNTDIFNSTNFNGTVSGLTWGADGKPTGGAGGGTAASGTVDVLSDKFKLAAGEQIQSLWGALALAFVGGFILNLMPCVLPVISIKILSFLEQAHDEPRRVRNLGLSFSAGITAAFLTLGAIVLGVQAAGQNVGWGFQFQYPGFIIAMCVIVLLLALSLFGMFFISLDAGNAELNKLANKEGYTGTFFKGVLATVLSTPCTAPFLGPALGFAFTQNPASVLLIFFTIGLGMSLPYLLLSAKPEWMRFLPKPGVWMEKLKESFGFILLATVVWLLYVLGSETGTESVVWTTGFLVAVSFAAWLISRFTDLTSSNAQKAKIWSMAAVVVLVAFYQCIAIRPGIGFIGGAQPNLPAMTTAAPAAGETDWKQFSVPSLNQALNDKKTVLLDFTAQWCLTCKVNESTVLASKPVVDKLKSLNVVTMRADWTNQDAQITQLLHKFNRSGVPLYVIFPSGKPDQPIVLPEVIDQGLMLRDLDQAGPSA